MQKSFWTENVSSIFSELGTGENGLDESTLRIRLQEQKKQQKKLSNFQKDLRIFLRQFSSPLTLLLVVAVILSAFLGETSDVIIILSILAATGILGYVQERNAGHAVAKLQSILALKCDVIRNGNSVSVNSSDVVTGDVVAFKSGDIVPADCFVIEANELHVNEASLTGESYPVRKMTGTVDEAAPIAKRFNCLWQGSNVISGTGKAVAVLTGKDTIFGGLEKSISTTTETAFEKGIRRFGYFLMKITVVLAVVILCMNLFFHRPLIDSLLFALALAIGMAPELLPAIMTIAMSAGAKRMSEKRVIVKKLSSIQNLGEVNLLCTDKTGTITEGVIKIARTAGIDKKDNDFVLKLAFLNAGFESGYANPIDEAIRKLNLDITGYKKTGEIPYDFVRKRLGVAVTDGKETLLIVKGAVRNVFPVCTHVLLNDGKTEEIKNYLPELEKQFIGYGDEGFRAIGVCFSKISGNTVTKEDEKEMTFAGFLLLEDPLKEGITEAISNINQLGVSLKIITGDNRYAAAHVAKMLNIHPDKILTGPEIETLNADDLKNKANDAELFAEVEPNQKEIIIRALQKAGHTVAYMGDGINDVAAINAADTGISINNAVDIAREAADVVLLEKQLDVLTDGIREGRKTFTNTLKYIFINTGATFGNMFSVAIASLFLPFLPMLPKQILVTNFLSDVPYLAISDDNVDSERIRKPGKWNLKQVRNFMLVFGIHSSVFDILMFVLLYKIFNSSEGVFQTGWFLESIFTELFILFVIRTQKPFLKSKPGKHLVWLSLIIMVVTTALIYSPLARELGLLRLSFKLMAVISAVVLAYVLTAEWLKLLFFSKYRD